MSNWDVAFKFIMDHEDRHRSGVITYDAGGDTKWGISSRYNPDVDVENLTLKEAAAIYKSKYFDPYHLDQLRSSAVAAKIADCLVNPGLGFAKTVQLIADVPRDGCIGPVTIGKLNLMPPNDVLDALCAAQEAYYNEHDGDRPYLAGLIARAKDRPA